MYFLREVGKCRKEIRCIDAFRNRSVLWLLVILKEELRRSYEVKFGVIFVS